MGTGRLSEPAEPLWTVALPCVSVVESQPVTYLSVSVCLSVCLSAFVGCVILPSLPVCLFVCLPALPACRRKQEQSKQAEEQAREGLAHSLPDLLKEPTKAKK
mmetsp:Transcript_20169/g.48959  ORF Transcript_20169/g.48959 Transcript_20169/m.48959 type:complete len:103 (-) Transcript_20169:261-569(-)